MYTNLKKFIGRNKCRHRRPKDKLFILKEKRKVCALGAEIKNGKTANFLFVMTAVLITAVITKKYPKKYVPKEIKNTPCVKKSTNAPDAENRYGKTTKTKSAVPAWISSIHSVPGQKKDLKSSTKTLKGI